jgi:hypothetical protein
MLSDTPENRAFIQSVIDQIYSPTTDDIPLKDYVILMRTIGFEVYPKTTIRTFIILYNKSINDALGY